MKDKILLAVKFIVFILLIPVWVGVSEGFIGQMQSIPDVMKLFFIWGIYTYLFIHFFIFEPEGLYHYGQNLVSSIFKFFSPLVEVAPFFFPIYSILILIVFYFTSLVFKTGEYGRYFMFFLSFTLTMHFVFTARELREKDPNVIKPNYFFEISFIYIINVFVIALLLNLIINGFSFTGFFSTVGQTTRDLYTIAFKQLFGV